MTGEQEPAPPVEPIEPVQPVALDPAGRIVDEITCRQCGYTLRGLAPSGRCPECRAAVERSVRGDLLRYCEPAWVERLARGMLWLVVAIVGTIVWNVAATIIFGMIGRMTAAAPLAYTTMTVVFSAVFLIGAWLLTAPDPGEAANAEGRGLRLRARIAMTAYGAVPALGLAASLSGGITAAGVSSAVVVSLAAIAIVRGVKIVGVLAAFAYVARLARRIPDEELAKKTRQCMWGLIAAHVVLAADEVIALLSGGRQFVSSYDGPMVIVVAFVGCGRPLLSLVYGIWAIRLLFRYRREMSAAAGAARDTWATADADDVR